MNHNLDYYEKPHLSCGGIIFTLLASKQSGYEPPRHVSHVFLVASTEFTQKELLFLNSGHNGQSCKKSEAGNIHTIPHAMARPRYKSIKLEYMGCRILANTPVVTRPSMCCDS
jgi:hypothetical protein